MALLTLWAGKLVGERFAPLLVWATGIALVVAIVWFLRWDAWHDGAAYTDAKWQEASRRLQEQARDAAGQADSAAERRAEEFTNRITEERSRIDAAEREGRSALDELFSGNGV